MFSFVFFVCFHLALKLSRFCNGVCGLILNRLYSPSHYESTYCALRLLDPYIYKPSMRRFRQNLQSSGDRDLFISLKKAASCGVSKLFVGEQVRPATIGITRSNHNFKLSDYTMSIRLWVFSNLGYIIKYIRYSNFSFSFPALKYSKFCEAHNPFVEYNYLFYGYSLTCKCMIINTNKSNLKIYIIFNYVFTNEISISSICINAFKNINKL